jgi:hypothetical protein
MIPLDNELLLHALFVNTQLGHQKIAHFRVVVRPDCSRIVCNVHRTRHSYHYGIIEWVRDLVSRDVKNKKDSKKEFTEDETDLNAARSSQTTISRKYSEKVKKQNETGASPYISQLCRQ